MKIARISLLIALAAAFTFTGCAKKNGASMPGGGTDGDSVSGSALPERQEGVSFLSANVDRHKFTPVYFAFDADNIGGGEQGKISQVASFMKSAPNTIIIAGFTDERGTPEYNRALGEKRALAVREALIHAGADGRRLQTVSFGAEMPTDPASNDSAWAKNRRAEFGVVR